MQLQNSFFLELKETLTKEFYDQDTIVALLTVLGIHPGYIDLTSKAYVTWASALAEIERQEKIGQLLTQVTQIKNQNPALRKLKERYENEQPSIAGRTFHYLPYTTPAAFRLLLLFEQDDSISVKKLKNQLAVFKSVLNIEYVNYNDTAIPEYHLLILLITPSLLGSDIPYIKLAQECRQLGGKVIPILCRSCEWERVEVLEGKVPLPVNGTFISDRSVWPDEDQAYRQIAKGVFRVIENIQATNQTKN